MFRLPEKAPFDRILVSAGAHEVPMELVPQLRIGGKMIIPVGNDILEIAKKDNYVNSRRVCVCSASKDLKSPY